VLVEYGGSGGGAAAEVVRAAIESCMLHGYLHPQAAGDKPIAMVQTGLMSGPLTHD